MTASPPESGASEAADRPAVRLDYPSPPLSPFDRPVDRVVRAADTIRLVTRVTFIVFAIAGFALAVWAVWRLSRVYYAAGR